MELDSEAVVDVNLDEPDVGDGSVGDGSVDDDGIRIMGEALPRVLDLGEPSWTRKRFKEMVVKRQLPLAEVQAWLDFLNDDRLRPDELWDDAESIRQEMRNSADAIGAPVINMRIQTGPHLSTHCRAR